MTPLAELPGRPARESVSVYSEFALPNDANTFGYVLGGKVMHLVDLAGATAAIRHSRCPVVTASVDHMNFLHPIHIGQLIVLHASVNRVFRTSMEVGVRVEVEADIADGLPGFHIVGLGDRALQEARERVKIAINNSGFQFPGRKVTINLANAGKAGAAAISFIGYRCGCGFAISLGHAPAGRRKNGRPLLAAQLLTPHPARIHGAWLTSPSTLEPHPIGWARNTSAITSCSWSSRKSSRGRRSTKPYARCVFSTITSCIASG